MPVARAYIFSSHGLEAAVVAVLGSNFEQENRIRTQWILGDYERTPPIHTLDTLKKRGR